MKFDGGPAFPVSGFVNPFDQRMERWPVDGMSLRDWFAGMALAGMCANGNENSWPPNAEGAYKFADAMLAERAK